MAQALATMLRGLAWLQDGGLCSPSARPAGKVVGQGLAGLVALKWACARGVLGVLVLEGRWQGEAVLLFERRKQRAETKGNGLKREEDKQTPPPHSTRERAPWHHPGPLLLSGSSRPQCHTESSRSPGTSSASRARLCAMAKAQQPSALRKGVQALWPRSASAPSRRCLAQLLGPCASPAQQPGWRLGTGSPATVEQAAAGPAVSPAPTLAPAAGTSSRRPSRAPTPALCPPASCWHHGPLLLPKPSPQPGPGRGASGCLASPPQGTGPALPAMVTGTSRPFPSRPVPSHPTGSEGGAGLGQRQHPGSLPTGARAAVPSPPHAQWYRAEFPPLRHLLHHDGWWWLGGRAAHLTRVPAWLGTVPRPGRRPASVREGKAGCCVNLAPLPAALERRIPPQKESTPTPRVTHLPAPLPRTHTALTLHGWCRAAGCQRGTGQGASPSPLPREEIPSASRTGASCRGHPLPTVGIASPPPAPAPRAEASDGPSPSRRPKAGR